MQQFRLLSVTEQVAAYLRQGLQEGRWSGRLPGVVRLATECDVSTGVVRGALRMLEDEGLLSGRGLGRSRGIASVADGAGAVLRVAVLRHDARLADNPQTSLVLAEIMHSLEAAGHEVVLCEKSQVELKHDVRRLSRHLAEAKAGAWVVESGSRPLLEWCAVQPTPCLALYGCSGDLPLARTGPCIWPAFLEATRHLIALGHRRIVLIMGAIHRNPKPGFFELAFLQEMNAHGVPTGDYNVPDWEETPEGFLRLLKKLFKTTPPTALIIDETPHFLAAVALCAMHGIRVPGQVSLVSTDCDATLDWCHPGFAHLQWDNKRIVTRVVRWANAVRKGNPDRKAINFPVKFVPGGSIGPVPKG